ncbi:alpha/beta hydrolase [Anaerolentibacter hominis]|uniref:alpha/beta fold hydrolase n=1 Tax=Anaerolentibacter hominis TaxID=3079009 RepID=UPI0031B83AB7
MPYFTCQHHRIYYIIRGNLNRAPLLFFHGNTASLNMFEPLLPLYENSFCMILIDFLRNGQSESSQEEPFRPWYEEALQAAALIRHLDLQNVNLVGVSAGAWAAVNTAMLLPERIGKVVADSFGGLSLLRGSLSEMQAPILLLGSREDELLQKDLEQEYVQMAKEFPHADLHLFNTGSHPSLLSNAEAASKIIRHFLLLPG